MKLHRLLFIFFLSLIVQQLFGQGNPFVRSIYTADPSAHVWNDGRLYVYPSHDIDPPRGCDLMDKYHVFSTNDMVNWIDHGQILEAADVPWAQPLADGGKFMWAPDCAFKDGKYYFYFPHPDKDPWNSNWKIGIAVSDKPASDFKVLSTPLVGLPESGYIDPCVFIDDDSQAYFYYGGGGHCFGAPLKANMVELDGVLQPMTGLYDFHEGTWVFKHNGLYYLAYADNKGGANQLRYAISTSPLGPWKYKGVYLGSTTSDTSHGSVVEYKGQWWAFYHTADLSGTGLLRSICVDSLFFNGDGTIKTVSQTKDQGFPYGNVIRTVPGKIEAEDYNDGGKGIAYWDNTKGNGPSEYRRSEDVDISRYRPREMFYVTGMSQGEYLNYTFNVLQTGIYSIDFTVGTPQADKIQKFYLEFEDMKTTNPRRYDVAYSPVSALGKVTVPNVSLSKGTHTIRFVPQGDMNFDNFIFYGTPTALETVESSSFKVFPNPSANGIFQLQTDKGNFVATVMDNTGRIVLRKSMNKTDQMLDLTQFGTGIYILRLQSDHKIFSIKLVYN